MTEDVRIPAPLAEACRALYDIRMEMAADADVRRARRRVMDQTKLLQDAENELSRREAAYQQRIEEVEAYIQQHALEVGASFESGGVKVRYTRGYDTVSLPKAKLDAIRAGEPELAEALKPYLKTSTRDPRVTIE
jgi:hypothetical protein